LKNYKNEIIEGIDWLDKELLNWSKDIYRFDEVINKHLDTIQKTTGGNIC